MAQMALSRTLGPARHTLAFALFLTAGLAASRLLYEGAFPRFLFFAHAVPVALFALATGLLGWMLWLRVNKRPVTERNGNRQTYLPVWSFSPLAINLLYLFDPAVNLLDSRLIFAASIWLTALLCVEALAQGEDWTWPGIVLITAALLPIYLGTMSQAVGEADTFEFQVVIPQMGIAHPTGYPLYLLLGRLFTFLPIGTTAWRVNLASTAFALPAALIFFSAVKRLLQRSVPAVLAAVVFGLTPVFWSQAIQAEVYALQALIVSAASWLMITMLLRSEQGILCTSAWFERPIKADWRHLLLALAFVIGAGLANHLTSLFLLPPAFLTVAFTCGSCLRRQGRRDTALLLLGLTVAFVGPLLLYAYLPLRWSALHGEPMGIDRFIEWVIGGRFQGALRLTAWLTDWTRYAILGRLFLQTWGWVNLILIAAGVLYVISRSWRAALVLGVTWLGYAFYALNYYVPDLAVFLIPGHLVMALFWGAGLAAVLSGLQRVSNGSGRTGLQAALSSVPVVLLLLPAIGRLDRTWSQMTAGDNEQLLRWGEGVLAMPLENGAAILADSEKIAPLYYLQQAEGIRSDLDIVVLPDEAAYRAELDARIAAGQTVYLARFLPGLAGTYSLRSFGPLLEASREPLMTVPDAADPRDLTLGGLRLAGAAIEESSPVDSAAASVTLYWQLAGAPNNPAYVYLRWAGQDFTTAPTPSSGQYPANNSYPAAAWRAGEVVPDFHLLPRPLLDHDETLALQVAVGPPFEPADSLEWQTVGTVNVQPGSAFEAANQLRAQNGRVLLSGADFSQEVRPQTPLPVVLSGYGTGIRELQLQLVPAAESAASDSKPKAAADAAAARLPFAYATELETNLPNGAYLLISRDPQFQSTCGWLSGQTGECILGQVNVSGIPLPAEATNYDDKVALLDVELPQMRLDPGGELPVTLHWQALSTMDEDYTVFLQVLNSADQIVGQVDSWPVQGTFPTSEWQPGETIDDPYLIRLAADLPPGEYRLQIGWYLLATLQRLPVLDDSGQAVDDKREVQGLNVPQ